MAARVLRALSRGPRTPSNCKVQVGADDPRARRARSVAAGFLIYIALVAAAFVLGRLQPLSPGARPVPTTRRTICTRRPRDFDAGQLAGKTVLITGAAGFIGSHVARRAAAGRTQGSFACSRCQPCPTPMPTYTRLHAYHGPD